MSKRIHYYTDGSCLGNPGKGSWGVVSTCGTVELWGVEPDTTNNRMELTAIIGALVHARKNGVNASIYSDSELCIKCILGTYKKKANKDLWLTFDSLKSRGDSFQWVRGHDKDQWNIKADQLCRDAYVLNEYCK